MAGLEAGRVTLKQQVEKLQNTITDFKADSHAAEKDHATKLRETIESLHEAQSSLTSARQSAAEAETALQTSQSELTAARAEIIHLQDALAELKSSDALHKSQLAELGGARDEARSKTEEARTLALELDEIRKAAAAAEAQVSSVPILCKRGKFSRSFHVHYSARSCRRLLPTNRLKRRALRLLLLMKDLGTQQQRQASRRRSKDVQRQKLKPSTLGCR